MSNQRFNACVTLLLLLLLTGCLGVSESVGGAPAAPPTPTLAAARPTPTRVVPVEEPAPAVEPAETAVDPLAGLVLAADGALWQIDAGGAVQRLASLPDDLAGDMALWESQLLYRTQSDDLALFDLQTAESRQLTATPDRVEAGARWWPARPTDIVFNYVPTDQLGPWAGYLATLNLETGDYRILEGEIGANSGPAMSPDGQTVAVELAGEPWLISWDGEAAPLVVDTAAWQIDAFKSPAWSPDGQTVAWIVQGPLQADGAWQIGTLLVDVATGAAQLLHPYAPLGGGGWLPQVSWSPDGRWLGLTYFAEQNGARVSQWVVSRDGAVEHHLGNGERLLWHPDGDRALFAQIAPGTNETTFVMLDAASGDLQPVDLPLAAPPFFGQLLAWRPLT